MSKPTLTFQIDELCKRHNLSDKAKKELIELIKEAYIQGVHSTWDILTDKKQSHEQNNRS